MDVRDEQSVSAGVDRTLALLGGVDVLVNNAGIGMRTVNPTFMTEPAGFWHVSPDGFRDLFATNVVGYFLVARAVVPHTLAAGRGKIVNISVNEATMRRRGFTPYGPSRAATDALSHIMAADLVGTGRLVRAPGRLAPGEACRPGAPLPRAAASPPGPARRTPARSDPRPASAVRGRVGGRGGRRSAHHTHLTAPLFAGRANRVCVPCEPRPFGTKILCTERPCCYAPLSRTDRRCPSRPRSGSERLAGRRRAHRYGNAEVPERDVGLPCRLPGRFVASSRRTRPCWSTSTVPVAHDPPEG